MWMHTSLAWRGVYSPQVFILWMQCLARASLACLCCNVGANTYSSKSDIDPVPSLSQTVQEISNLIHFLGELKSWRKTEIRLNEGFRYWDHRKYILMYILKPLNRLYDWSPTLCLYWSNTRMCLHPCPIIAMFTTDLSGVLPHSLQAVN